MATRGLNSESVELKRDHNITFQTCIGNQTLAVLIAERYLLNSYQAVFICIVELYCTRD